MAERTVTAKLVLDLAGYTPNTVAASKSTSALATAQKDAADSAKVAGLAQRDAATAAKEASATASASAQAMKAAMAEAANAAKEASAAQVDAAMASTDAERVQAEAVATVAAERAAAATEALDAAKVQAEADAQAASAAKAGALEAARYAQTQRDVAAAAKEAAGVEAAAAKESEAAAVKRTKAYKDAGAAATTAGLVTAAGIGLMTKAAGDYESATTHFVTDAGESQKNLGMVQAGILKIAVDTGTSATALTDAMYHVESAGYHGAEGLNVLTIAAEAAKVGNADLGTMAKTMVGIMNSYNMSATQAVPLANQLIATVAAGDMKMNDLSGSIGNVAAIAASAKVSFPQVAGAVADMTSQNVSADRATQDLANTISALQKPNQVAVQQMQALGLNANDVSQNLGSRGLTGTLQLLTTAIATHTQDGQVFADTLKQSQNAAEDANTMLAKLPPSIQGVAKELLNGSITAVQFKKATSDLDAPNQHLAMQFDQLVKTSGSFNSLLTRGGPAAETYNAALSNMLGGQTGLNTALLLTGSRMATFEANVNSIQAAADKGGTSVDNWAAIQGTFNQKIDVAKASLGVLGIVIGTTLLPVISDMAKWIAAVAKPIAEWVDKNQTLTAVVLGSVTALAALVLVINGLIKVGGMVKNAIDGVKSAVDFVARSSKEAKVETDALAASQAAAAKEADTLGAAQAGAAVEAEAAGAANAAAGKETEAAAVSTGSWAGKLGASIPILGAVVLGAQALGGWLNKLAESGGKTATSVDQWTASLLSGNESAQALGVSTDQAQKLIQDFGAKANSSIEPMAALGVVLAKQGQMMGKGSDVVKSYDGALAALVSGGHADRAAQLMTEIASATDKQGKALINTQKDFPQYFAAVDKATASQALAASATTGATAALGDNSAAALAQAQAIETSTTATADSTTVVSGAASQQLQAAAAARALADAQAASADATNTATGSAKAHTAASVNDKAATGDAAAAAKAHEAASKSDTTAQKDAAKAATDQGKANTDSAKASDAAAKASALNGDANATAAQKKKANAEAANAAAAAAKGQANADSAASHASDAASAAADKHASANDKSAKASSAAASAAAKQAKATAASADQAAAEAEAAREATEVHKIGVTWLQAVAAAENNAAGSASSLDSSVTDEVTAMKDAAAKASNLKDALDALNGVHIAASKAAVDEQQKVADLTKAFYDNGKSLDITTEAGRKNITAIDDLASAANAHAQAVANESGSIDAGNKALDASRAEFDAVLRSAGFSTAQIDTFNKTLLNTPKIANVVLSVSADTTAAAAALQSLENKYAGTGLSFGGGPGGKHIIPGMATGGLVTGAGGPTSDSVPIAASAGEYIVKASAVQQPGVLAALNSLNFGNGSTSVVKPSIPLHPLPAQATSSSGSRGAALHVENYFENGAPPQQVAAELGWLAKSRGGSW